MDSNIIGQTVTGLTTAATRFTALYVQGGAWGTSTTTATGETVMPVAGTLKNLYVNMDTGSGTARVFTVQKNGTPSTLSATIASSATSANDTNPAHNLSFVAGDVISLITSGGDGATSTGAIRWSLAANAAANVSMLLSGSAAVMGTTFPVYISPHSSNLNTTAGSNVESVMPTAGTIQNAYVVLNTAIAAGTDLTFTLFQNGSPTSLAVVINTATTTGNDLNGAHAVTVVAGDRLYWKVTSSVAPATKISFVSAEFDPSVNGESVHMFGGATAQTNSAVRYQGVSQTGISYSATEPVREALTQAATWQKLYVFEQTSIVAGSWAYIPMINNSAAGPTVTITSGQTGNDTSTTTTTNAGDTMSMRITPASAPTASIVEWGIVSFIAPPLISVSESTSLSESITVSVTAGGSALSANASDTVGTSESVKPALNSFININDPTTTSESIKTGINSFANVSDAASSAESIKLLAEANLNISDSTSTSENVVPLIPTLQAIVSDSTTLSENVSVGIPASGSLSVNVSDSETLSESIKVEKNSFISVSDSTTLTENVVAFIPTYPLVVNDSIATAENVVATIPTLPVNTSDSSTLSENLSVQAVLTPQINKSDSVTLSESISVNRYYPINKSETVTITENVSVLPYTFPQDVTMVITKTGTIEVSVARQANPSFKIQTGAL